MKCASVKKKGSDIQCSAKPLKNHTLCGRHAKCKHVVLWTTTQQEKTPFVIHIQRRVRGWLLRKRLILAGPGVLSRGQVSNDEDISTMSEKDQVHPFKYFAFEENGKIWWFEINTIQQWIETSMRPVNPYTKVPLTIETRKRLREIVSYHIRYSKAIHEDLNLQPIWNLICQCFEDYGFGEINSRMFLKLNKYDYSAIFRMIGSDLKVVMKDHERLTTICDVFAAKCFRLPSTLYTLVSAKMLLHMMYMPRDPYVLLFTILSALYRV